MLKFGRLSLLILCIHVGLFFGVSYAWENFPASSFLQFSASLLSFIWLAQAHRSSVPALKKFWFLLGGGMLLYTISNAIWFFFQMTGKETLIINLTDVLWIAAYSFFLAALLVKTRKMSTSYSPQAYIFNIFIYMITSAAVSIHYLITPVLQLTNDSLIITIFMMVYPILNLSIIFLITIMYYLMKSSKEKDMLLFLIIGFFLQIIADSFYAYLSSSGAYYEGHPVDVLWIIAILFIGFAASHKKSAPASSGITIKNPFEEKEFIFPYSSMLILAPLVMHSYEWKFNALTIGLWITFVMTIGRQLIIINKNNNLMKEYRYLAYHDPLTGLKNRVRFQESLKKLLNRTTIQSLSVLLIDLDRFKVVNDTLGHQTGDRILMETANRIRSTIGKRGEVYRLGGDEFVIIHPDASEETSAKLAQSILDTFQQPFDVKGYTINLTPSIGISLFPGNGRNDEELLKTADAAMYVAKESGKNSFRFYNQQLDQTLARKLAIENELRRAISGNQFSLVYQPKFHLVNGEITGVEALLRWKHPDLGWISPAEFIPVAEETGQIVSIGEWVLKEACLQNKRWQETGQFTQRISVNVSVLQLQQENFLKIVQSTLEESKLDPSFLELEITESIMQNISHSLTILHSLKGLGIQTSIDDFGTGYSSLHILQKLPIDTIKIDKSFIDEMEQADQRSMVKMIIDLGHHLDLNVVAEGIETESQRKLLMHFDCNIGQGYLYSKPLCADDFEKRFIAKASLI
ncbi:EAL domain-containing protein [Jeotgalibacillus sp. ET6]|uniref:putative bifunctional diguanylate cyclase/phosphodiesterase n=1 Tax=Jeotgalibacillus sp. ET6 TaxID=3037260 RepID=UPI0024185C34|nr:EAL domain-containing protein [Jeotgalibacillus sp. ET6]MDG5472513.1 EAL domain-containing protein [Jeotgalibacillus sp. ET6]